MKYVKCLLVILLVVGGGFYFEACNKDKGSGHEHQDEVEFYYTCPMHPSVVSDKPGSCPVCGMRLVKKVRDSGEAGSAEKGEGPVNEVIQEVSISPTKQVLANVSTSPVELRDLTKEIHTVGFVAYDKDLYVAEQAYLSALKAAGMKGAASNNPIVQATKGRLELMGISDGELDSLRKRGKPDPTLLQTSSGKKVWIYIDLYEGDIGLVKEGTKVDLSVSALPGKSFHGAVKGLVPVLSSKTRTSRARVQIDDSENKLQPEMFATATVVVDLGKQLVVPSSAVVDTGMKRVVWIEKKPGVYIPHHIREGKKVGDYFIILEGLKEGDKVVSQGGFLLDSESELKSYGGTEEHKH